MDRHILSIDENILMEIYEYNLCMIPVCYRTIITSFKNEYDRYTIVRCLDQLIDIGLVKYAEWVQIDEQWEYTICLSNDAFNYCNKLKEDINNAST